MTPGAGLSGDDPAATFGALFDAHAPGLHRYLASRAGGAVAEDLVSETFVLALRRRETFDPERGSPQAWLFGIASNLLRHHHRDQARHLAGAALMVGQLEHSVTSDDHAVDRMDAADAVRRLLPDLLRLSDIDRDILLLNAWAGLAPKEIADALGLPAGTVRSKLSRLRRELRGAAPSSFVEPGAGVSAALPLGVKK